MKTIIQLAKFALLLSVAMFIISCSNNDDDQYAKKIPTSIEWVGSSNVPYNVAKSASFDYDDNNRLVQYSEAWYDETAKLNEERYTITYVPSNCELKHYLNNELQSVHTFEYESDYLISFKSDYKKGAQTGEFDGILALSNEKKVTSLRNSANNTMINYRYDYAENVIKYDETFSVSKPLYRGKYTYDLKTGMLTSTNTPQWLLVFMRENFENELFIVNNVLTKVCREYVWAEMPGVGVYMDHVTEKDYVYSYNYDDAGFPTSFSYKQTGEYIIENYDELDNEGNSKEVRTPSDEDYDKTICEYEITYKNM